jgi:uncharacterized protein (TIGR00730 family)
MRSICVYCGSADNVHPDYLSAARQMGLALAKHRLELIYGAGSTGLMGALADSALGAGGQVTGVIPAYFNTSRLAHRNLTRLEVVETIQQRKARMAELADAFIALPGGFGTFEELFEMLTWAQVGLHHKPIGLLNVREYFDPLLAMVEHAKAEGFIYAEHRSLFTWEKSPEALLKALSDHQPPPGLERWLTRS